MKEVEVQVQMQPKAASWIGCLSSTYDRPDPLGNGRKRLVETWIQAVFSTSCYAAENPCLCMFI